MVAPGVHKTNRMLIQPIDSQQQQQVIAATEVCIARAVERFQIALPPLPVLFDLSGRAAGMYRVQGGQRWIRYNPHLFAKYFRDNLAQTVPHEVAHYVCDGLHGLHNIRPHGQEWRRVMHALGAEPRATGDYDLAGIPQRRQRRFAYQCDCHDQHQLSAQRHNRIRRGEARYLCRVCGGALRMVGEVQGL